MAEAEPALIAHSNGRAQRSGADLILRFVDGHDRTFHNDDKGCQDGPDHCDGYTLIGDLPALHWFVLFEYAYEGGRFYLYDDRDGLPTILPYWPTFSSNGERLLIQNDDVSDNFAGDSLEIWRRDGYRMEREWIANPSENETGVHTDGDYHTQILAWTPTRITLRFRTDEAFNTKTGQREPARTWTGTIDLTKDGWLLHARAPDTSG